MAELESQRLGQNALFKMRLRQSWRLLRYSNRRDAVRIMLSEIYNWLTEGFDTADLKDAKALLDELSAR